VDLLDDYRTQTDRLCNAIDELATVETSLARSRALAFRTLNDGTRNITQVTREMEFLEIDMQCDVIELQATIRQCEAKLRLLDALIDASPIELTAAR
jgi:hypothetical protein